MPNQIFAKYVEKDIGLARVWLRSWKSRGWRTGIRFSKTEGESMRLINFSLRSSRGSVLLRYKRFGARGWETSPLVMFPAGSTEDDVLTCGRSL